MTSFCHQFKFHDVIYQIRHYVILTIDSVTSFLKLLDVQNVSKKTRFSLNKSCGIVIDFDGFVHIFNLFEC